MQIVYVLFQNKYPTRVSFYNKKPTKKRVQYYESKLLPYLQEAETYTPLNRCADTHLKMVCHSLCIYQNTAGMPTP